ncbi:MAG: energy-coupling factor transporter transmembrane component T family protein [Thermodesulfobacteriota bacterium]
MDIGLIDYFANTGGSFFHRASPIHKITFVVFVLTSIVITDSLTLLISTYLVLTALVILTRLPFVKVISIAAYPAIFALLFALAGWNGSWTRSGIIVFKALSAALTMTLLIVTTPYPSVFAAISPFLPRMVVEGLFLTYRSLFILLELMGNLIRALRLRGGLSPRMYAKNIANFSSGIGLLLVRGLDLSERLYGVMKIRGYGGKMAQEFDIQKSGRKDFIPVATGFLILLVSLVMKFESGFDRYSVYVLIISAFFVVAAVSFCSIYGNRGAYWKN